jgi:hypothetical protein
MEEKYIRFYQSFHKGFQNKKTNSLFCSSQSRFGVLLVSFSIGDYQESKSG